MNILCFLGLHSFGEWEDLVILENGKITNRKFLSECRQGMQCRRKGCNHEIIKGVLQVHYEYTKKTKK